MDYANTSEGLTSGQYGEYELDTLIDLNIRLIRFLIGRIIDLIELSDI